jgi:hydroxypyruvate isomerase
MENPEYRTRFEWLVQRGWTMAEAEAALEATKQGGSYSSTRADAHLKAVSDQARVSAVAKANAQMAATNDESLSIAEDSSCASVLSKNMDAVDIVIKLKTTHAQTKARAAHTAQTAVGAANLGVQMDLYHCQIVEGDVARKIEAFLPGVSHMQIAGVPDRHEPSEGELNFPYLFALIDRLGYRGHIGCEYRPRTTTTAGLGWLKPYLA